jgi:hypothetical protein
MLGVVGDTKNLSKTVNFSKARFSCQSYKKTIFQKCTSKTIYNTPHEECEASFSQ